MALFDKTLSRAFCAPGGGREKINMAFRQLGNRVAGITAFGIGVAGGVALVQHYGDGSRGRASSILHSNFVPTSFVPVANAESSQSKKKERLVVLGSGWGAVGFVLLRRDVMDWNA